MKNPFRGLKKGIKDLTSPQVRLKFSTCGEVMIDGLPFSFGVQSIGIPSDKGLVVSISGEAVENGELTFDFIELNLMNGMKVKTARREFSEHIKTDGKKIYQSRFPEVVIPLGKSDPLFSLRRQTEEEFISQLTSEISFKTIPHYKGKEDSEVMITVYPVENPMNGLAVQWKSCTSDTDWFLHRLDRSR